MEQKRFNVKIYHKSSGEICINFVSALVLLLLFCVVPVKAGVNAENDRDGAIQIDGHWIGLNWPLADKGTRSSSFGKRIDPFLGIEKAHGGIDIVAPFGTDVLAALGGRIVRTGFDVNLGNYVIIKHSGFRETIYGHLSAIKVKEGQYVNPRKIIGKVGSSGRSTGSHLHFAVKKNGKFVDPQKWMVPTGLMLGKSK
jgi:murein DD-endopeptidase MepM/ murein hydrolase activator NlpD